MRSDPATVALATACAAFVAVPALGEALGPGERTERYDTVVTPPGYAFAVWGPIFAACATDAVARLRSTEEAGDRVSAWPLAGAYLLNTAWSVAAQTDRFAATPGLLCSATVCAGAAHRRLQAVDRPRRTTTLAAGSLLGWTVLATTVNIAAEAVRRGAPADSAPTVAACTAGLVAAGGLLGHVVATSRHGAVPVAATGAWGLLTTALDVRRPRLVRVTAAVLGSTLVGRALLARRSGPTGTMPS